MNKQTDGKTNKVGTFLKKNIYYILMVVAVLAIISMIVVAAVMSNKAEKPVDGPVINTPSEPEENNKPSDVVKPEEKPKPIFIIDKPVMTDNLGLNFSDEQLVFHPTQGAWKTHLGIDYMAKAGTDVMAVFDGKVASIDTDGYTGTTMVVEHMDGFKSVYKLMNKDTKFKVGESVKKGDVIGTIGNTSTYEVKQGEHLHFELMKDGKLVDPNLYFKGGDK